ncbi:MAG: aminoglycoside phosphotransferase family protein [Gammaproteobacteria bacterium]
MQSRFKQLTEWLTSVCPYSSITPLPRNASFRLYYRIETKKGRFIVLDAPPEKESCENFVLSAQHLLSHGLPVPQIIQSDLELGFAVISDFGDYTLQGHSQHYKQALDLLSSFRQCPPLCVGQYKAFDAALIQWEFSQFEAWYLEKHLGCKLDDESSVLLKKIYGFLEKEILDQPSVFMHRDYHSMNLMVREDESIGILDFQDAMIGPVTYDLASLLRDCYVDLPHEQVRSLALYYKSLFDETIEDDCFLRWFDLTGIQRHMKALFTFARKHWRDQQSEYLKYIPRTLAYIMAVSKTYPELSFLTQLCEEKVTL